MMVNDRAGRLLICAYDDSSVDGSIPASDLIGLTASMQRKFADQVVEPADLEWLRQAVGDSLPLPPPEKSPLQELDELDELVGDYDRERDVLVGDNDREPIETDPLAPSDGASGPILEALRPEYVYVVLAWLGGVVSRQAAEHAIAAAADLIRDWMQERRDRRASSRQVAIILGPDGEVLKTVEVRSKARQDSKRRRPKSRS
jgi:hypothetical protein